MSEACHFVSENLSDAGIGAIQAHLKTATSTEAVKAAFTNITEMAEAAHEVILMDANMRDIDRLIRGLEDTSMALRETA